MSLQRGGGERPLAASRARALLPVCRPLLPSSLLPPVTPACPSALPAGPSPGADPHLQRPPPSPPTNPPYSPPPPCMPLRPARRSLLEPIRTSNEFCAYLEANCDLLVGGQEGGRRRREGRRYEGLGCGHRM